MTKTPKPIGVAVLGATGYAGAELIRLLGQHPHASIRLATSRRWAGQTLSAALPATAPNAPYAHLVLDNVDVDVAAAAQRGVEVVFACLPHGQFAAQAEAWLGAQVRVIDLSADYRLRDAQAYLRHYHFEHAAPKRLEEAVYGLGSWFAEALSPKTRLVANPGCYATAILLAALPAAKAGWLSDAPLIINALSGVSGAGRALQMTTLFAECQNSVAPYKVGESHAHLGEIGQALGHYGVASPIIFNPHLVPMARGIMATLSLPLTRPRTQAQAQALYQNCYAQAEEIVVLPGAQLPETRFVRHTNRCDLAVRLVADGHVLLVFSAIDNLLKGAAGQAVENFNRLFGHAPQLGLPQGGAACG
jgi:N-acetyl-gamma-glutamyl-phosphate reductase